jgi:purine nucleosidase
MALALHPDGATELVERPLAVELAGTLTRGATVTDWNRQTGRPDNARLLLRYDQDRFEALVQAALAAG